MAHTSSPFTERKQATGAFARPVGIRGATSSPSKVHSRKFEGLARAARLARTNEHEYKGIRIVVAAIETLRKAARAYNSKASNPSIERTFQRPLRALWPAAHVER